MTTLQKINSKFNIGENLKGYGWVLLSILAVSNVYIFSKIALKEIEVVQFAIYWFAFGILWVFLFTNKSEGIAKIKKTIPAAFRLYIFLGLIEIVSTGAFFIAMKRIENPSITAFLTNMTPVFVTLLGVTILKDRFKSIELIGALFTISGAFIISYRKGAAFNEYFDDGSFFIYISAIASATGMVIIKKNIAILSPQILTLNRQVFIWVFAFIFFLFSPYSIRIPNTALIAIMVGSFFGPFLSIISSYNAIKYLEISKQSILSSSKSIFVLLGAYLFFGKFPAYYQILGGIFTVIGAFLISFGKVIGKKGKT